ncbi:alcohol dehydrogenase catalytic domain-containing protein [Microbacterium memoriense]|uniref:Alcohol dehydrogenase catalytic domain-containing protein n=1 Tax=Microbacterium memoriense TaxID=2978350 RepID=A0ABT2PB28_9MICO|nr:alcohol dehydrogenase catalytic domain-containing protein [Microbacterium memoriense]MCT9001048.1 alcohol dehydrogenase catalytic domain-containing protein [Microbacterium memoriense]
MTHTVRALRVHRDLMTDVGEISAPDIGENEVRVGVAAAGVCGSDIHAVQTGAWIEYWPATLGHEVVGTITESRSPDLAVGTAVAIDSRIPCRACADCAVAPQLCARLTWLGESRPGGFAEEVVVPAAGVYPFDAAILPMEVAVLAEPLAVVLSALLRLPRDAARVLILGYGPIGALSHLVLRSRGIDVIVAESDPGRLAAAAARGAISASTGRERVDAVIDAAGYPGSVATAFTAVRRGGTVVVVALGDHAIDVSAQELVEKCVTIAPSIGFDDDGIPTALAVLAASPSAFADVVSDRIVLDELAKRLAEPTPTLGKIVVTLA